MAEIGDGEDAEHPLVGRALDEEAVEEGAEGCADSGHQGPPSHLLCTLVAEEDVGDNAATDTKGRADEDCVEDTGHHLGSVGVAKAAADVADAGA